LQEELTGEDDGVGGLGRRCEVEHEGSRHIFFSDDQNVEI